jgi:hypothetical protein
MAAALVLMLFITPTVTSWPGTFLVALLPFFYRFHSLPPFFIRASFPGPKSVK